MRLLHTSVLVFATFLGASCKGSESAPATPRAPAAASRAAEPLVAPIAPVAPVAPALPPDDIIDMVSGARHVCVARRDGSVSCFGANEERQLDPSEDPYARGARDHSRARVPVEGVVALVAEGTRTCGLTRDGRALCWGAGAREVASIAVAPVAGAHGSASLAHFADADYVLPAPGAALAVSQTAAAWVSGAAAHARQIGVCEGSLCVITSASALIMPTGEDGDWRTLLPSGVRAFAADNRDWDFELGGRGRQTVCALMDDGSVRCGDYSDALRVVPGVAHAAELGAGDGFGCARLVDGTVSCWGLNDQGQLGRGSPSVRTVEPAGPVPGLTEIVGFVVGRAHACARRAEGPLLCWGHIPVGPYRHGDTRGLWADDRPRSWLRDDTMALHAAAPQQVPSLSGAIDIVATRDNSCALLGDGHVKCWGGSLYGQNGDGTRATRATPVLVAGIDDAVQIASNWGSVCARRRSGAVTCWGASFGAPVIPVATPVAVESATESARLYGSLSTLCSSRTDGTTTCWGFTPLLGASTSVGVTSDALRELVSASNNNTYTRAADGTIVAHTLSRGALRDVPKPLLTGATSVVLGHDHSCAISADAHVLCWGADDRGQLGLGESAHTDEVRPVENLEGATAVVNGDGFGCAIHGGSVTCWGDNSYGQLGRNIRRDYRAMAVDVAPPLTSHVIALAAGQNHVCAVRRNGTVWCFGDDTHGTLGDGRATYRTEPTPVDLTIPAVPAVPAMPTVPPG